MPDDISKTSMRFNRRTSLLIIAGAFILSAACAWGYKSFYYDFVPKRFGVVEEGSIYRSGQMSAALIKKVLVDRKIRIIVDLTGEDPKNSDQQAEKKTADELNIKILRFPLGGKGTGDVNQYAAALIAIADARKNNLPILVHCSAGTQRTGGVIAIYRLLVQKKDPAFVINEMKQYGWNAKDNPDLLPYLNSNMPALAEMLKQAGIINEIPNPLPRLPQS